MVEGPPLRVQRTLQKHTPYGDGIAACEKTEMAATEIFFIPSGQREHQEYPAKHSPGSPSVREPIYSKMSIDDTSAQNLSAPGGRKNPKERPEKHSPVYTSVNELIYSEKSIDDMFKSVRSEKYKNAKPFSRWYHLPANNVSTIRVFDYKASKC